MPKLRSRGYLQETNYCAKSKVTLSATYYITIRAFKNVRILSVDTLQVKRRISQDLPHATNCTLALLKDHALTELRTKAPG